MHQLDVRTYSIVNYVHNIHCMCILLHTPCVYIFRTTTTPFFRILPLLLWSSTKYIYAYYFYLFERIYSIPYILHTQFLKKNSAYSFCRNYILILFFYLKGYTQYSTYYILGSPTKNTYYILIFYKQYTHTLFLFEKIYTKLYILNIRFLKRILHTHFL